jgi:lipid-A-disaccharide synthase-like uncharacterized protein
MRRSKHDHAEIESLAFLYTTSLSTAFCLVYFLSKKDPVVSTFFTNLKIDDKAETQTLGYI